MLMVRKKKLEKVLVVGDGQTNEKELGNGFGAPLVAAACYKSV